MSLKAKQSLALLRRHRNVKRVIEIGVGRGAFARTCVDSGIDYTGIDANPNIVDHLRDLQIIHAQVPPFPELREADVVVAEAVLEHMPTYREAEQFVRGTRALLPDDGLLMLYCPDFRFGLKYFFGVDYSHSFVTSLPRVTMLLVDQGYDVLEARMRIDCFFGPWCYIVWLLTRLIPTRLLEWLTGYHRQTGSKSRWRKIKEKIPAAFVVGQKKHKT
jgi:predicted TPR repeat methyltransferase